MFHHIFLFTKKGLHNMIVQVSSSLLMELQLLSSFDQVIVTLHSCGQFMAEDGGVSSLQISPKTTFDGAA